MRYLKRQLGDLYDYVGVGRGNGKNSGEFSAIFYLKNVYEVAEQCTPDGDFPTVKSPNPEDKEGFAVTNAGEPGGK